MRESLTRWREAFWSVPAVVVLLGVVLAQVVLGVDRWSWSRTQGLVPDVLLLGVDGSRAMLGAIGGSMLAVAGTTFSITISVIATASSTYGPRLVRNFMTDRRNQVVLGLFVGTFVYSMIVLRSITGQDDNLGTEAFVPYFAVYGSLVLALLNVAALVYFLHHISESIQIGYLIARVRKECEQVVRRYYLPADAGGEDRQATVVVERLPQPVTVVVASEAGSVTMIDGPGLVSLAAEHGVVVRMLVGPGHHVLPGEPVAEIRGSAPDLEHLPDRVLGHLWLGGARTPAQDVLFSVQQLTEIAVRALSPGTNDPYTARNLLVELARPLQVVTSHPDPAAGRVDDEADLRLVLALPSGTDVVDDVFDDLRTHGVAEPHVVRAVIDLAARLRRTATPAVAERLRRHADLMVEAWSDGAADFDVERMRAHLQAAMSGGEVEQQVSRV